LSHSSNPRLLILDMAKSVARPNTHGITWGSLSRSGQPSKPSKTEVLDRNTKADTLHPALRGKYSNCAQWNLSKSCLHHFQLYVAVQVTSPAGSPSPHLYNRKMILPVSGASGEIK
jgi:hypothetical protein